MISHNAENVMSHHEYCDTRDPIIRTKPCNCPPGWPRSSAGTSVQCSCSEVGGGEPDYTEGCGVHGTHKWEIEPHLEPSDADILIVDDDAEALQHILQIAEHLWDQIEPGEERVLRIRRRKV